MTCTECGCTREGYHKDGCVRISAKPMNLAALYAMQPRIMLAEEPALTEFDFAVNMGDKIMAHALGVRL